MTRSRNCGRPVGVGRRHGQVKILMTLTGMVLCRPPNDPGLYPESSEVFSKVCTASI